MAQISRPFGKPTAQAAQITLKFTPVANANSYTVEASTTNFTTIAGSATGATSPLIITGLTNGTNYKVRWKATGSGFTDSNWRYYDGFVTPSGAIQNLSMPNIGDITLADESIFVQIIPVPDATGYTVQASDDDFSTIASTASGTNASIPFELAGLDNGIGYEIRAFSTRAGYNNSKFRTAVGKYFPAGIPLPQIAKPTLAGQVISNTRIDLSWAMKPGADYSILERATNSSFSANLTELVNGPGTSFSDTGLPGSSLFFYRLKQGGVGYLDSQYSSTIALTTMAGDSVAPTVTSRTAINANTIRRVFSEAVTASSTAGNTFNIGGVPATITGQTISGNTIDYTVSQTMTSSSVITDTYVQGSGNIVDLATPTPNPLASFSNQPVSNAIPVAPLLGYFLQKTDDTNPTEAEILAGTSFAITDGQNFTVTIPNIGLRNIMVFEPSAQPQKTLVNDTLGDAAINNENAFGQIVTIGAFRGYKSNYQTAFDTPQTFKIV